MKNVKIGIIGIGNMGATHCRNILAGKTKGLELVAVADTNPSRLEWAKEEFPASVQQFSQGTDLIKSGVCDAVLIAVPHYQHPELCLLAFENKQHVMCEKPAGVYTKAVREVNEAAEKSGLVYALMYNQRTNCLYRKMHEIMQSGEMGQMKRVVWLITNWFRTQHYYDSGAWRATWAGEGGGVLLNQCPHNLDLLQWICGLPTAVQAFCHEGKWHDIEVEDDVTAYLEFENGATGVFITSTGDSPGTNRFEIHCENGVLLSENGKLIMRKNKVSDIEFIKMAKDNYTIPESETIEIPLDGENPQHVGVLSAFAACILENSALVADGKEGIRGLMLSNAMHLSSWLGEKVSLPVDEDLFLAELDKRRAVSHVKDTETNYIKAEGSYGR